MINTIINSDQIQEKSGSLSESSFDNNLHEQGLRNIQKEKDNENIVQQNETERLKKLLNGNDNKQEYLKNKIGEIDGFYKGGKIIINNITLENLSTEMQKYVNINDEKVKKNINIIVQICKQLSERTKENIYSVIGYDGSIHLINDIDTGHYIISKDIIENGDVSSFIRDVSGKKEIAAEKIESLEDMASIDKNKILQVRENLSL